MRGEMLRLTLVSFAIPDICYTLHPDHSAINPVLCLHRNLTPEWFPLQDINSVYLATKPLLNSFLSSTEAARPVFHEQQRGQ